MPTRCLCCGCNLSSAGSSATEDDTPGSPLRVVLTDGYWQRRFGGAENIVGQSLVIDGRPAEVIGVLPSSFKFLRTRPDIVLPMPLDVNAARGISFGFQALARLKTGVTLDQANADVARMISVLPPVFARLELRPDVRPLADDVIGNVGEILWILLAAVGVVLLIACGNVANLFLVRAEGRHQEFAMRAALGASRGRIARALLAESVVLALAGGAVGVALASGRDDAAANDRARGAAACRRHRHRCDSLAVHPVRLRAERSSCSACLRSCDSGSPASRRSRREDGRQATPPGDTAPAMRWSWDKSPWL